MPYGLLRILSSSLERAPSVVNRIFWGGVEDIGVVMRLPQNLSAEFMAEALSWVLYGTLPLNGRGKI